MLTEILPVHARGLVRMFQLPRGLEIGGSGWEAIARETQPRKNTVLYDWATPMCQLLRGSPDGKSYFVNTLYVEFENNAGAAVTPPTVTRADGIGYYDALDGSGDTDFLRLQAPLSAIRTTTRDNDTVRFMAATQGSLGVNGLAFSSAQQSRVFGAALVCAVEPSDPSQDIVIARYYFSSSAQQLIKAAASDIAIQWDLILQ